MTTRPNPTQKRIDPMQTSGIRANRDQEFRPRLMGYEIYDFLELFEEIASEGGPYMKVSKAVLAAETLRERAKAEGF